MVRDAPSYLAIDLGAGSGRVFLASVTADELLLEEVRRFQYPPKLLENHLRWNSAKILEEIKVGISQGYERACKLHRPIESMGVDSWGVDYAFLDDAGRLIEEPICYRDGRTEHVMEQVFAHVSRDEIFERTGVQSMVFNTLFQLYAHMQEGIPPAARMMLLIPDLVNSFFTGKAVSEHTNATTTQMVDPRTGTWAWDMLDRLGLPTKLLPEIVPAGTKLGPVRPAVVAELGIDSISVVAPATHDTGSAVAGTMIEPGWAYISSGTWSLVGVERDDTLINEEVGRHNFTNEGGAFGTIRFLKNVMGLWILESCRKEWKEQGFDVSYDALLARVDELETYAGVIYPDDARFFRPTSMLEAIAQQLAETGEPVSSDPPVVTRMILDSLALRYGSVLRTIESLTNQRITAIQIIGGGSRNDYLNQATANVTALPVFAGPIEATVVGNVIVQAITSGRFASLPEARRHVAQNLRLKRFDPIQSPLMEIAIQRYPAIEARYL